MKAFPSAEPVYSKDIVGVKESTGMDLRDYFAAKAMQGFLSASAPDCNKATYARWSYEVADAMMEARKVKND
jgi:hypothetical protein